MVGVGVSETIQQLLDGGSNEITLPLGEWEGPFVIKKPCCVVGMSTTLWAKKGPALIIDSKGVTIKNLRIEITEALPNTEEYIGIKFEFQDTKYHNIEIVGDCKGLGNEDNEWDIPKVIKMGEFPAEKDNTFFVEVNIPCETVIHSYISGITIEPKRLSRGKNIITLKTEQIKQGSFIYGSVLFESKLIRRMYLTGIPNNNLNQYIDNRVLYHSKENLNRVVENNVQRNIISNIAQSVAVSSVTQYIADNESSIYLKKGQRVAITAMKPDKIRLQLLCAKKSSDMEIDPYVFLLDKNNKATNDESLIFFGNKISKDGSIKVKEEGNHIYIDLNLNQVSAQYERISIAYSIYGDNPNLNFSKVVDPTVLIFSEGIEKMRFTASALLLETTIVVIEFYRYKGDWKINTVGAGYRDGLKKLCESYGLVVD